MDNNFKDPYGLLGIAELRGERLEQSAKKQRCDGAGCLPSGRGRGRGSSQDGRLTCLAGREDVRQQGLPESRK